MTMSNRKIIALSFTLCCTLVICILPRISTAELPIGEPLSAGEFSVYEDIYIRQTGTPETVTTTFVIPNPNTPWRLRVLTGNIKPDENNVTSATITLNGVEIMKQNQFKNGEELFEFPVTLLTTNTIEVRITSKPGGLLALMIIGIDETLPTLSISAPNDGDLLANSRPTISGVYSDDISGINSDSFLILLDDVDITSKTFVGIDSFEYTPRTPISDGAHTLSVSVEDNAGNMVQEIISFVTDSTSPVVNIVEPSNLSVFGESPVTAIVTVADENMDETGNVTINGINASFDGTDWTATLSLFEGTTNLVATAIDSAGNIGSDAISIRLDTAPPLVVIESPADGDRLITETISIAGTVNDIIPGSSINDDDVSVTVNGMPAAVKNRTFFLPDAPLSIGTNIFTAVATDRAGNSASTTIEVSREPDLRGIRILIVDGNAQSARINTALPLPLTVRAQRKDGTPEVGRPIVFTVSRGDGLIGDPSENLRNITVLTDATGIAQMNFTLGSRTGEGFHRVRVTTPGSLTYAEFCATAQVSDPVNIAVVMAPPNQSPVNQPLTNPISAIVTDTGGNPVAGVPVTFKVHIGGGNFNGQETIVAIANSDGIAEAEWILGPAVGISNNEASADFPGNPGFPATFIVSGVATGPVEETRISGIVQDSTGNPIAGAKAVIRGTDLEVFTGADGEFTITDVLPGGHHVGILGSAANDLVNNIFFPDIDFAIEAISGVDNKLDQIVILPFLDNANAKLTGGDQDVILAMSDVPGFSIKVFANSTFVRDPVTGELIQQPVMLSSSQVKFDKVPMAPPQGSAPLVVGTIQPAGVIFNPPAAVCYPNTTGLAPGDVADIFAFHHDIGSFVSIGPGTVSEDGSVVCSDSGFGIVQSGWHCTLRRPAPTGNCADDCSSNYLWNLTRSGNKSGGETPVVMCIINQSLNPDLPVKEQQRAKIDVVFSPAGGEFVDFFWSVDNPSIVSLVDSSTVSATIESHSAGTTTLRSPTYTIPLPAEQGGNRICQAVVEVKVGKVAFDIGKVKVQNVNLVEGEDKAKCTIEIYDGRIPVDLSLFLTDDSVKENIVWTVNNQQSDSKIEIGEPRGRGPANENMIPYFIEAVHKEFKDIIVDGKQACSDEMVLVAVSKSTQDSFDNWIDNNQDLSWTDDLPAMYETLNGFVNGEPPPPLNLADPEPGTLECDFWEEPTIIDNEYHPGTEKGKGAFYEIRSLPTKDGYGHQATYTEDGKLITEGLAAGTADKSSPSGVLIPLTHGELDAIPYIWAMQLDGNPVKGTFGNIDITGPILHHGDRLKEYLDLRPTFPNEKKLLTPLNCEPLDE